MVLKEEILEAFLNEVHFWGQFSMPVVLRKTTAFHSQKQKLCLQSMTICITYSSGNIVLFCYLVKKFAV